METMEGWVKNNASVWKFIILFIIIVAPVFIYLTVKAQQIDGWDDWWFGSAQVMSTMRYWAQDGFIKHKILFITHGYHPQIEIFDRPEFRFLTRGTATGGLIGKRLWYTHYPPGYLIPGGVLAKFGVQDRFWFRVLQLTLSFISLIFLLGFVYLITDRNKWIALLALFYYATSTSFLAYSDTLTNQPADDFFRWLILFLSIYAFQRVADERNRKRFEKVIWAFYFLLAASSYDSTLFVIFWLCALTYIASRKLYPDIKWHKALFLRANIKKYFFWLSAPLAAFFLQMVQNVWYLGLKDMALDVWGSFFARSSDMPAILTYFPPIIKNLANGLSVAGLLANLRTRFALPLIFIIVYCLYKRKAVSGLLFRFIIVLGIAGTIFGSLLIRPGIFGYQGRQAAPALLIIFAIATYEIILMLRKLETRKLGLILAVLISVIWFAHFKETLAYVKNWPNNAVETEKIRYWRKLNQMTNANTIIVTMDSVKDLRANFFLEEFYTGRLIISFEDFDVLLSNINKIHSVLADKSNFFLILPKEYKDKAVKFVKSASAYDIEIKPNDGLSENLTYINATHRSTK